MKFFRIFFVKMTKEHQISNFLPFKPPFHPFRGWFRENPFLVNTYILIGTYMPNFTFLSPVVSALRWSSVSQSVSFSFYICIDYGLLFVTAPVRSSTTNSPQLRSRPASQPSGPCLEVNPTGIQSITPQRCSPVLNEGSNETLQQRPPSPCYCSAAPSASVTRPPTPSVSPSQRMRRVSRTGIHPMLGAGLAIREAFGKLVSNNFISCVL